MSDDMQVMGEHCGMDGLSIAWLPAARLSSSCSGTIPGTADPRMRCDTQLLDTSGDNLSVDKTLAHRSSIRHNEATCRIETHIVCFF